ncbi:Predicted acetyltransferase [Serratia plymuthica]|nr:Predicted acetyltransferase [Serratia plymuthica]
MPEEKQSIHLRPMIERDLSAAFGLSQQARWPHRLEDWQQAWALGAGVVAVANGETVGTALRWLWGENRATLGLVIVDERHRGQGIARAMMQTLMASLADYQLHLVASEQGKPLYRQLGFIEQGGWHSINAGSCLPARPCLCPRALPCARHRCGIYRPWPSWISPLAACGASRCWKRC